MERQSSAIIYIKDSNSRMARQDIQSCAFTEKEMQHINDVSARYIPKSEIYIYLYSN